MNIQTMKTQRKISNPLTIIAIFAGLAEINGTVVLSLVPVDLQEIFVWFIILFPSLLVIIFFVTLNWNPKVLYSPSDFLKDESFIQVLNQNRKEYKSVSVEVNKDNFNNENKIQDLKSISDYNFLDKESENDENQLIEGLAEALFDNLRNDTSELFDKGLLEMFSYEFQAPGFYLLKFKMNEKLLNENSGRTGENIIIRLVEKEPNEFIFIALGKNIVETNYKLFSNKLAKFITKFIETHRKDK